jgi:peroxiredoxin
MQNRTDTLQAGSRAPDFSLSAANRDGSFSLASLLTHGPVIVEFLRGTW